MQQIPDNQGERGSPDIQTPPSPDNALPRDTLLVLAAATLGRLPALGAFWNRDDWLLLARATGLVEGEAIPARMVGQVLYWRLLYPLFGLATDPWTWTRLGLHAAAAWLVMRLARRIGLSSPAALLAGLLFAAAPLAFTPLYWAAGAQELLGAVLALLAVERLLAGSRGATIAALAVGLLAVFTKENALGLGFLVGAIALAGDRTLRRTRLITAGVLIAAAVVETSLLLGQLPFGPGNPYVLAPLAALPETLVMFGWWLATPAPVFVVDGNLLTYAGGLLVWTLWLAWSYRRWRIGDRLPAAGLGAALLSLAPALGVVMVPRPYLAYLAFAPAVLVLSGAVWGGRRRIPPILAVGITLISAAAGWLFIEVRLNARGVDELPADTLVLHTAVSHGALQTLDAVPAEKIVILQMADMSRSMRRTDIVPVNTPLPTILHDALAGDLGRRLYGGTGQTVHFVRDLKTVSRDALVFADSGTRLLFWGPVNQAYIYQALTGIAYGRHDMAVDTLWLGLRHSGERMPFVFDESQLPVGLDAVRARKAAFFHRIETRAGLSPDEREAMITTARELFSICHVSP